MEQRLAGLSERREAMRSTIDQLERQIVDIEATGVMEQVVRESLRCVEEVYDALRPYEQKELCRLMAHGRPEERFERLDWLPDEDSNLEPTG